jgi:hypothetical protein
MAKGNGRRKLPQVAETNTPRMMDADGKSLLYYESRPNVHLEVYRFQILKIADVEARPPGVN